MQWKVSPHDRGLKQDDLKGSFQPTPFYDSMVLQRVSFRESPRFNDKFRSWSSSQKDVWGGISCYQSPISSLAVPHQQVDFISAVRDKKSPLR